MSNPDSLHNYFGWPSAIRLKNGDIAIGASGYRLRHVCPFGKAVMAVSHDEGNTYTGPTNIIDTHLDDRDCGFCTFGESGLIVTSFNNTIAFQRHCADEADGDPYSHAYLDKITPEMERADIGSTFRVSFDNGVTFGELYKSPITSPHGPIELSDGTILYVGRTFSENDAFKPDDGIKAYTIAPMNGKMKYVGEIENIYDEKGEFHACEPYAIELPDGRILCHIRMQRGVDGTLTIYQSESSDKGKTWTKPTPLCGMKEGAPSHLLMHSSGVLICTYGHRESPYGIRAAFSHDLGKTWDFGGYELFTTPTGDDLGYPMSVELRDGSIITVFYSHVENAAPAVILQTHWKMGEVTADSEQR